MPVKWEKIVISSEPYESCGVFDVNNDGVLDIVSGAFWYEGPHFKKKHKIGEVLQSGEYYDDFSTIPFDINGDGYLDYITGGWFGQTLQWRENPKGDPEKKWLLHEIDKCGNIEKTCAWDIDLDGEIEIIPNCPAEPVTIYKLKIKGNNPSFNKYTISNFKQGHGLGCGDINNDGRPDIVINTGWKLQKNLMNRNGNGILNLSYSQLPVFLLLYLT